MASEMAVLDQTGDTKVIWDAGNEDEVANARRTFSDLRKKGYFAYKVNPGNGSKGEQMTEFDPQAQKIIMAPQLQGG